MLRKRSRSVQKDQYKGHLMSDSSSESSFEPAKSGQKQKNCSFFNVPGLFVGFNINGGSDSDSVRSPTSPLDYKVVSNPGNSKSGLNGIYKSWDCEKVGLGIIDVIDNAGKTSEDSVGLPGSGNILFGSQMRMNIPFSQNRLYRSIDSSFSPKSLPKNYPFFPQTINDFTSPLQLCGSDNSDVTAEIQSEAKQLGEVRSYFSDSTRSMSRLSGLTYCNNNSSSENFSSDSKPKPGHILDISLGMQSCSLPISISAGNGIVGSLSASDIELSEDYTCIVSHGPNPRTTHIFSDCVLECHTNELANSTNKMEDQKIGSSPLVIQNSNTSPAFPSDGFLSFCYFCKKKFEEGNDIYMYRGEKSFCSCTCRDQGILAEEELEKLDNDSPVSSPKSTCSDDIFPMGMI